MQLEHTEKKSSISDCTDGNIKALDNTIQEEGMESRSFEAILPLFRGESLLR